jgi:hypothetical protein
MARNQRRERCRVRTVSDGATIRINGVATNTPQPLRLVEAARPGVKTRCSLCGPHEQSEMRWKPLSAGLAGVITCHQLECGHAWHRTIANVGGIFPGLVRNATFAPCDCLGEAHEAR